LVIERKTANGKRTRLEVLSGQRQIRIPLWEENVRVDKRAVVRETVDVTRRQIEELVNFSDAVHQEQLRVTTEGRVPLHDSVDGGEPCNKAA
jgi:uncharacterized protein (TIGR02271 family)